MEGSARRPLVLLRLEALDRGELVVAITAAYGVHAAVDHGQVEPTAGGQHRPGRPDLVGDWVVDFHLAQTLAAVIATCRQTDIHTYIHT